MFFVMKVYWIMPTGRSGFNRVSSLGEPGLSFVVVRFRLT